MSMTLFADNHDQQQPSHDSSCTKVSVPPAFVVVAYGSVCIVGDDAAEMVDIPVGVCVLGVEITVIDLEVTKLILDVIELGFELNDLLLVELGDPIDLLDEIGFGIRDELDGHIKLILEVWRDEDGCARAHDVGRGNEQPIVAITVWI